MVGQLSDDIFKTDNPIKKDYQGERKHFAVNDE